MPKKGTTNLGRKTAVSAIAGISGATDAGIEHDYEESAECRVMQTYSLEDLKDPEVLEKAYDALAVCRDIYGIIPTVRSRIFSILKFVFNASPGFIKARVSRPEVITFDDLEAVGVSGEGFAPLVDLGAFNLNKLRHNQLDLGRLEENNVREIVLMEDRSPIFFLNYSGYRPDGVVPLNRHSNIEETWTMQDLKNLIDDLHVHGIKFVIGFWGNAGSRNTNPFVVRNWETLKPVIPVSDDINPLSFVVDEYGRRLPFAEYIVQQYRRLNDDFELDGLFLGDGLMGYRAFFDSDGPYYFSDMADVWTDFYRRVYTGLKETDPSDTLWAYDCLGKGSEASLTHGVDIAGITPYVDNYVFQSYGSDAWGEKFMALPGYDLERDLEAIQALPRQTKMKTKYCAGLRDNVEGWSSTKSKIAEKHKTLSPFAGAGSLGVWSNDVFRRLL
jgi:hypothetical protein